MDASIIDVRRELVNSHKERERREWAALRRQIALNIEFEIKSDIVATFPMGMQTRFETPWEINRMDLIGAYYALHPTQQTVLTHKYKQSNMKQLFEALHQMKAFSENAHPITLDGEPLSLTTAKQIVAATQIRVGQKNKDLSTIIECAENALSALHEIRMSRNEPNLLIHNS